jgi:hypothetical protein
VQDFAWWPEEKQYPDYDSNTHRLGAETITLDHEKKVAVVTYVVDAIPAEEIAESVAELKAKKILAINVLREQKIYSDIAYEFPDGPGVIQLRNNQDIRNIQSLVLGAQMQIIAGNPDAPMVFRDLNDNIRQLTAAQIAQMGAYVLDIGQAVYTDSWALKNQVNTADSFEALEAINTSAEWPGEKLMRNGQERKIVEKRL